MVKHLTIKGLIKQKAELKERRTNKQKQTLFVKSLDGNIVIEKPDKATVVDALGMDEGGDQFLVYECVVQPKLKDAELHEEFGVSHNPVEIVDMLFEVGEVSETAKKCLEFAGYGNTVQVVNDLKN